MYQALYRKWRPKRFADVVGQSHITDTLKRQVETGRASHAYLFIGSRGTGKTTCAKILAKAVNCQNQIDGEPCNACPSCIGIDNGSILDVEEIDAASNNGVDNVRALRDEAVYSPASVNKRVYIVDEVHMLSTAAFNALLKILEEPPAHLIFVLATTELHKVPATIMSRCQRFAFRRLNPQDIAGRLLAVSGRESITLEPDAAALLARMADGSMRDALSLLDQCAGSETVDTARVLLSLGLAGSIKTVQLLSAIIDRHTANALSTLNELYQNGKDMGAVLEELSTLVRDILIRRIAPSGGEGLLSGNFDEDSLKAFAHTPPLPRLMQILEKLQPALTPIGKRADNRLNAELCIISLSNEQLEADFGSLLSRIADLEEKSAHAPHAPSPPAPAIIERKEPPCPDQILTHIPPEDKEEKPVFQVPAADKADPKNAAFPALSMEMWLKILQLIKEQIDIGAYSVLSDPANTETLFEGDNLTLQLKNAFAKTMLDNAQVSQAIREAARAAAGRPIQLHYELIAAEPKANIEKLNKLRNFSNTTFK